MGTELLRSFCPPIHNPYWEAVRTKISPGEFPWETPCIARFRLGDLGGGVEWGKDYLDRREFVNRYAWSVTDPGSVRFVATYSRCSMIDPMAGTGYWAYLLKQLGIDVVSYDSSPGENSWSMGMWVPVKPGFAECVVDDHPDRVLFLSWPPYNEPSAFRTLREFQGDRVIYIGEGVGGCTGDEDFHELLESEWHEIASHRPIQWWGLHDDITVFERGPWQECGLDLDPSPIPNRYTETVRALDLEDIE